MKLKQKLIKNKTFKKVFIVTSIIVVIFSFILLINNLQEEKMDEEKVIETTGLFYGPVPEGYDEEHYHRTGETKLKEEQE